MVKEGIVLGLHISEKVIEVDRAKVKVKGVRSFLSHAGFYWRFIKDFSKIAHTLCKQLEKDCKFYFDESCVKAFDELKEKLVSAPIIISMNLNIPYEVMCAASGVSLGMVLGERKNKILHLIYYTSKSLNET